MNAQEEESIREAVRILRKSADTKNWHAADQLELQILIGNPIYDAVSVRFAQEVIATNDTADLRQTQEDALGIAAQ